MSPSSTGAVASVDLRDLHVANVARQAEWCPDQLPDLSFRGNELAGEAGETSEALILHAAEISRAAGRTSNVVKKLERERYGWRGSRATKADLGSELADMVICSSLTAITAGIDLGAAVIEKFNETSEKVGLATRLPTGPTEPSAEDEEAEAVFQSERVFAALARYQEEVEDADPAGPEYEVRLFDAMKAALDMADHIQRTRTLPKNYATAPEASR